MVEMWKALMSSIVVVVVILFFVFLRAHIII
jgi:hypothetical protein